MADACMVTGTRPSRNGVYTYQNADSRREYPDYGYPSQFHISITPPFSALAVYVNGGIAGTGAEIAFMIGSEWTGIYQAGRNYPNDYYLTAGADFSGAANTLPGQAIAGPIRIRSESETANSAFKAVALTTSGANDFRASTSGGAVASDTTCSNVGTLTDLHLGGTSSNSHNNNGATFKLFVIFNRALTNGELQSLSDNPWQLFEPRRAVFPASAAAGYTHPTLSNARMDSMTATGGVPKVDYAF
jgi:hypothetical protein